MLALVAHVIVTLPLAPEVAPEPPAVVVEALETGDGVEAQVWVFDDTVVVWVDER